MLDELRTLIEEALDRALPAGSLRGNEALNEAIRVAVFPGGKRMRPLFTLLAAQAAGAPVSRAMNAACAIEFLHSSSLVLDDLPCMDNAETRRYRPAVHTLFGESIAVLAALALMNEAYRLFGGSRALIEEAALCIGMEGMIGGQAVDLSSEPETDLDSRDRKTTGLMRLTMSAGAIAGGASPLAIAVLTDCGERLGRAYQMLDDLNDSQGETGKPASQDMRHQRASYCAMANARERAGREVEDCGALLLETFGHAARPLVAAVNSVFAALAEPLLAAV